MSNLTKPKQALRCLLEAKSENPQLQESELIDAASQYGAPLESQPEI